MFPELEEKSGNIVIEPPAEEAKGNSTVFPLPEEKLPQIVEATDYGRIIRETSAEEVNKSFKEKYNYDPPYAPGTDVTEYELTSKSVGEFVRVYDGVNSMQAGGWLMRKEDIEGLSSSEIQNKYALPYKPNYVCDVELDAGTIIRVGEANALYGFEGKGEQIDLMQNEGHVGKFINERIIK